MMLGRESSVVVHSTPRRCFSNHIRRLKFRSIGSKSGLLILIWQFIISFSISLSLWKFLSRHALNVQGMYYLALAVLSISLIVINLLAEVVISRYKLVKYSLIAIWFLYVVNGIVMMSNRIFEISDDIILQVQLIGLMGPQYLLLGVFEAGAITLGIDQIITGTGSNISCFIMWLFWSHFTGVALSGTLSSAIQYTLDQQNIYLIELLLPVIMLSVGLILDFFLSHKLVQEPVTVNPVTLIFKVLKYAAKHKHPVRRSAFTYCENELPSRLDNGKSKYGGPFTNEQVEDVKTFWRILLVILVSVISFIPLEVQSQFIHHINSIHRMKFYDILDQYHIIMYGVPLYELLVYPCLRNRGPRILQSIKLGGAALLISSLYGLTVEVVQYFKSNGSIQCLYTTKIHCYLSDIPISILVGFALLVLCKSAVEFVCAQGPYNMRGILIGLAFTLFITSLIPGMVIYSEWKVKMRKIDSSRYGIWFYLTNLVLTMISLGLLGCVARWYIVRERDDITPCQIMVEDIYIKYQQEEAISAACHNEN